MRVLLALGAIAGVFVLAALTVGEAHEDNRYAQGDPGINNWVRGLRNKEGASCCDGGDANPAEVDWDTASGKYRARIEGTWYVVPDEAVIDKPNKLGYAAIWYYMSYEVGGKMTPVIRCFIPGSQG